MRASTTSRPRTTYLCARAGGADALAGAVLATTVAYVALWRSGLGLVSG